jgi:flagellar M-ring protein FliF
MDPLFRSFTQIWKGFSVLPVAKKASILAVMVASVVGIMVLVYVANSTEYRVLFSNLSSEDAGNIVSKLKEKKIAYELSASGNTILVPQEKVSELRLELAAAGLPQGGGVGFEIFDSKSLGVTEFVQQLNYQRALQGELARTINGLDEIQNSRVHIVIPKKTLFAEDQKKPTASVILKLKPGRSLRPAQIDGIVHLVASSIEGLSPGEVMVVDNSGKVLSKQQDDSKLGRLSNSQIEYQRNIEKDMTNRVQTMLEKVVGEGKAVVRISADLDFRIMEKMEEKFDPESPVVRSQQRQSDRSGMSTQTGTTPGAAAGPAGAAPKPEPRQEKIDEIINYEITKTVNKTVMPVGEIKKLSIAVLVDGNYVKNDKGVEEYQPRSKKEISDLEDLVKKSAGFDSKREDQVVVTNIPFKKIDADGEQMKTPFTEKVAPLYPLFKYVLLMAAVVLLVLFFLRPLTKSLMARGRSHSQTVPELQGGIGSILPGGGVTAELQSGGPVPMIGHEVKSYTESEVVRQLATADARKFADLLRNWLK